MRTASILSATIALLPVFAFVACATSDPGVPEDEGDNDKETPAATETTPSQTIPEDAGSTQTTSTPPPAQCVSSCTQDTECQNSCPTITNGIQCCDKATSACYASATSACPTTDAVDSGTPPSSY